MSESESDELDSSFYHEGSQKRKATGRRPNRKKVSRVNYKEDNQEEEEEDDNEHKEVTRKSTRITKVGALHGYHCLFNSHALIVQCHFNIPWHYIM